MGRAAWRAVPVPEESRMNLAELTADVVMVSVIVGAAGLGLSAHLCWLAVSDLHELLALALMFWRVVVG